MDYLISNILANMPNGMWEKIITAFETSLGSFALSIILLTIIIKLVMSPIDYFNRRTNKKMAEIQKRIKPQVEAINKKYANNDQIKNQKLGELYKREKVNPVGSCLVMVVNIALTFTIFITLFNGMNAMASYKISDQYEKLQIAYVQEYATSIGENLDFSQEGKSVYEICVPIIEKMNQITDETQKSEVFEIANNNVAEKYEEIKDSFLWIDNIWLADSPFKNSIPTYQEYASVARLSNEDKENEEYKQVYEQIMNPLSSSKSRANGYYILVVLCLITAFVNQWLMFRKNKGDGQQVGKSMLIIMPIVMALFTLLYTTMFSLYIITGQIVSIITTPIVNAISNAVDKHNQNKKIPTDRLKRI